MVTAVVAVCAVLAACAFTLLAVRRANERAERRAADALGYIDTHLEALAASIAQAVDAAASGTRLPPATLSLDLDEVVDSLVAEAAARTAADAVVLRIDGPSGRPLVASIGAGVDGESLDPSFDPPSERRFGSAVIEWAYPPEDDDPASFRSALATPLASSGVRGTLVAYSHAERAFTAQHADAVRALVADLSVALANARRFAEVEARINVDPATGVPNRRGYELELRRETARAQRTGRPVSVIVVGVTSANESTAQGGLRALARVVGRVARRDDIACMRGDGELAVVLPGTAAGGATALSSRIEAEATRVLGAEATAVTVGLVESEPDETADALDARIEKALSRPRSATITVLDDARTTASTATASALRSSYAGRVEAVSHEPGDVLRGDALEAVASELLDARQHGHSLAVVAFDVTGLEDEGPDAGDDTKLRRLTGRLDRRLGAGSAHRLGPSEFALVLPGSDVASAEALVDALQTSLQPPHDDAGLALSAGVTELADSDDAQAVLGRAQHALWQARQVGPGTVVVAVPGRRPAPPR